MRLLLDTHALIWWMSGEAGLSATAEAGDKGQREHRLRQRGFGL